VSGTNRFSLSFERNEWMLTAILSGTIGPR
jgi:hypothetical protein